MSTAGLDITPTRIENTSFRNSLSRVVAGAIMSQYFLRDRERIDLRYYELMMVVPQTDDEGLSATLERVNNDIGERGGDGCQTGALGGLEAAGVSYKQPQRGQLCADPSGA